MEVWDLSGSQWATSVLYLQGISLVRRNNEWHHFDPLGTAGVITNGSAQVVSNNVYDIFGVLRHQQGSAQTPWRWKRERLSDESILLGLGGCSVIIPSKLCIGPGCSGNPKCPPKKPRDPVHGGCLAICKSFVAFCRGGVIASKLCEQTLKLGCEAICADISSRKPFEDCTTPCKSVPKTRCMDCCAAICPPGGSTKRCNTYCTREAMPDDADHWVWR